MQQCVFLLQIHCFDLYSKAVATAVNVGEGFYTFYFSIHAYFIYRQGVLHGILLFAFFTAFRARVLLAGSSSTRSC